MKQEIVIVKIKGISFGIIGALVGIIPNLFLKSLPIIFFPDTFNLHSFDISIFGSSLEVTNFGIESVLGYGSSFSGIVSPLFVGGVLFGLIGAHLGCTNSPKNSSLDMEERKISFWWSFFGGMLFNLIFIFYIPVIAS